MAVSESCRHASSVETDETLTKEVLNQGCLDHRLDSVLHLDMNTLGPRTYRGCPPTINIDSPFLISAAERVVELNWLDDPFTAQELGYEFYRQNEIGGTVYRKYSRCMDQEFDRAGLDCFQLDGYVFKREPREDKAPWYRISRAEEYYLK